MTDSDSNFAPYQTDFLFLLVGSNPLPNFVAGQILTRAAATVFLLHSEKTSKVADRLTRRLAIARNDLNIMLYGINEADGPSIFRRIQDIINEFVKQGGKQSCGLNFTGGTKPMAAYAVMGIRKVLPSSILSYLDARTLSMIIDEGDGTSRAIPTGRAVDCTLEEIVDLHGYKILSSKRESYNVKLAKTLAGIHEDPATMKKWRDWIYELSEQKKMPGFSSYPELKPFQDAITELCSGDVSEAGVANALGYSTIVQCIKYFTGEWLEVYTRDAIGQIADSAGLNEYSMSLMFQARGRPAYEIDLVAVLGYQVFSISCIATENKAKAKVHLLEIFARAGQLGGDESRFALVTVFERPDILEKELAEDWDAEGKIRVFGRNHIPELSSHLLKWFREANQEAS